MRARIAIPMVCRPRGREVLPGPVINLKVYCARTWNLSSSRLQLPVIELLRSLIVVKQSRNSPVDRAASINMQQNTINKPSSSWDPQFTTKKSSAERFRICSMVKIVQRVSSIARFQVKIFHRLAAPQIWMRPWRIKKSSSLPIFPKG